MTSTGILLLIISAMVQASEHVLEERLYRRDPKLEVVECDVICSLWKMIFIVGTLPIFSHVPVPTSVCSSGVLESNLDAIYELSTNSTLMCLFAASVLIFVLG